VRVQRGAKIDSVKPGSPAEQAGLPVGGVIVRFNDRTIASDSDLINAVKASRPGQEVEVSYFEGNQFNRKLVRLGAAGASTRSVLSGDAPALPPPPGVGPAIAGSGPGGRPLLQRLERMADNLSRPAPISTVFDPHAMADLQKQVVELTNTIKELEQRLQSIESKVGTSGGAAITPAGTPPTSPGLGGPSLGPIPNP
jgi:hypothetical protein